MDTNRFFPPYSSSTIIGLGVIAGAVCSVLLDQATPKQAAAAALAGLVSVLLKQATGNTLVTGSSPLIQTDNATVTPLAGSTTTVTSPPAVLPNGVHAVGDDARALKPIVILLATGLSLGGCAQTGPLLNDVRLFCALENAVVAVATVTGTPVLAMGQSAAYVNAACDLIGGKPVALPVGAGQVATVVVAPVRESGL